MKLEFSYRFPKKAQIPSFIKIRSVGAALLHADGHMSKLIAALRNFANAPKKKGQEQY